MLLRDYLTAEKESAASFGRRIGALSPATVYRYLDGRRRPTPQMMQKIIEQTNGLVTPSDFFNPPSKREAA